MSQSTLRDAVLKENLRTLKLPGMSREYPGLAHQARDGGWDYEEFLGQLLEAEVRPRKDRVVARRLQEAHFPVTKTLDQLDWKTLQGVSRPKVMELASCAYIQQAEDLIPVGPVGTGKTHIVTGLSVEVNRRRFRVVSVGPRTWCAPCWKPGMSGPWALHRRLRRADLLIIDELGFVPFDRAVGELLFNSDKSRVFDLLSDWYETRSTAITSNLSFGEWVQVFGDEKLTTALLDRLEHHAHLLVTGGPSQRTRQDREGGTV